MDDQSYIKRGNMFIKQPTFSFSKNFEHRFMEEFLVMHDYLLKFQKKNTIYVYDKDKLYQVLDIKLSRVVTKLKNNGKDLIELFKTDKIRALIAICIYFYVIEHTDWKLDDCKFGFNSEEGRISHVSRINHDIDKSGYIYMVVHGMIV